MSEPAPPAAGHADLLGVHYALRLFLATTVLWLLFMTLLPESDPIWAISSMIATSDPNVRHAMATFWGRIFNSMIGCVVGLLFVVLAGHHRWALPAALAATALVSSYLIRIPVMWRQAPITAAIVVSAGLVHHAHGTGLELGLRRVAEVMLGCVIGLLVTWLTAKVWPPPEPPAKPADPARPPANDAAAPPAS